MGMVEGRKGEEKRKGGREGRRESTDSADRRLLLLLLSRFSRVRLCGTPCDPIDGSPPGSPIPGILQARTLEWVAISFSNA